jgi:hypothetical protein
VGVFHIIASSEVESVSTPLALPDFLVRAGAGSCLPGYFNSSEASAPQLQTFSPLLLPRAPIYSCAAFKIIRKFACVNAALLSPRPLQTSAAGKTCLLGKLCAEVKSTVQAKTGIVSSSGSRCHRRSRAAAAPLQAQTRAAAICQHNRRRSQCQSRGSSFICENNR